MFEDAKIKIYLTATILSGIAGLAYQFRPGADRPDTYIKLLVNCFGSVLYSSIFGLTMVLIGLSWGMASYPEALIGIVVLISLGGPPSVERMIGLGGDVFASIIQSYAKRATEDKKGSQ